MLRFLIHAPHGLFFTIPANQAMYYAPADPTNISAQLRSMATFSYLPIISASRQRPDTVLSRDIFYYSPEGTYETITQGTIRTSRSSSQIRTSMQKPAAPASSSTSPPPPLSGSDSRCPSRPAGTRDVSDDPRRKREGRIPHGIRPSRLLLLRAERLPHDADAAPGDDPVTRRGRRPGRCWPAWPGAVRETRPWGRRPSRRGTWHRPRWPPWHSERSRPRS